MHPTPTEHHDRLKAFKGTYQSEVKIWFGPGDPMLSTGTMTNTMQVDGLYLQQEYVGDPNEGPFPSFIGKGFWGYNTYTDKYEGFWIDNASTMMQLETGSVDESGKVWEMHSQVVLPDKTMNRRSLITWIDEQNHTMEMFFQGDDGVEFKNMEIKYSKV